jgi:hypothetical protein
MQPIPRGSVPLDGALMLSFFLYSSVLISACVLVREVPATSLNLRAPWEAAPHAPARTLHAQHML